MAITLSRRRKKKTSFFKTFFKLCFFFAISCCGIAALILLNFSKTLPDLGNLTTATRTPSVTIQTYDGKCLGNYGDMYEKLMRIDELPSHVPAAFIAIEDRRYFQHFGIDFIGFFRALFENISSKKVAQGGSTITQQLAKNILINEGVVTHYDRSISRKIKELLLAFWLEHKFSKKEILMMYLNRVYFGSGTYGIDAAAHKYFDKSANELNVFEAAILAGLLKAPSKFNPSNHPNFAYSRAMVVLEAMESQGFIQSAKDIENKYAKATFEEKKETSKNNMYYCDFAYDQAKKILGEISEDIVVVTTFDAIKQNAAEEAVRYYIDTEGKNYKFNQASFICMARDGAVLSMIGGAKYSATQFNRATQANRLPGSVFKIFVYGAAIEHGYQLSDMISDEPISIAGWEPKNYKWKTLGQIALIEGFTYSVNTVCIRLAQAIGLNKISNFAKKLGIYDVSTHDMSVAIGTTPVTLKDITAAYTSFMDGMPIWPYCVTEIRTKAEGKILYQRTNELKQPVLDDETLSLCRTLLRTVVLRGTGRATNVNSFIFGKTGSNGDTDAWFIGFYDPKEEKDKGFSYGIWIGNDSNHEKMTSNSTGGRIPTRISKMFLEKVFEQEEKDKNITKTEETAQQKSLGEMLIF